MSIKNNPFYILKISCNAGRREIVSAADEMSFFLDPNLCVKAQNDLINTNKRLSAEISWFMDVDSDTIDSIRTNLENNEPISTDGLSPLSKLNASLYNFSLITFDDHYELGYSILDIDEQYSSLDIDEITEIINNNRKEAKLGLVQNQDVTAEIGKKRSEIRQIISEKLTPLEQDVYIELVTMIAEKCIADDDYNDGVILSDVVDQYEIRIQSALERSTVEIEDHIEKIKDLEDESDVSKEIELLICKVEQWDTLAQPLQLKSQASGVPHETSEHLGYKLRNLALFLHNEKGMTKHALSLVNAMKSVFAELGELAELFDSDSGTLNDLLNDKKEAEEVINEFNYLQKKSEDILNLSTPTIVDYYVECVKKLNQRLKTLDVDYVTKNKIRENLCYMARGAAIELHNIKHQTDYALTIVNALLDEFRDMPSLRIILNKDSMALMRQSALAKQQWISSPDSAGSSSSSSTNKGWVVGILGVLGIIILIIVFSSLGKCSNNTSSASSSNTQGYSKVFSSSESSSSSSSKPKQTTSSRIIKLSASNFETYFSLNTDAEFVDDEVTITYSISPIGGANYNNPDSSDTIEVEIGAVVSILQYNYGDPEYNKKHSITLEKSKGYAVSGSFSFKYYSFSDTVYWLAKVTSCSGQISE